MAVQFFQTASNFPYFGDPNAFFPNSERYENAWYYDDSIAGVYIPPNGLMMSIPY